MNPRLEVFRCQVNLHLYVWKYYQVWAIYDNHGSHHLVSARLSCSSSFESPQMAQRKLGTLNAECLVHKCKWLSGPDPQPKGGWKTATYKHWTRGEIAVYSFISISIFCLCFVSLFFFYKWWSKPVKVLGKLEHILIVLPVPWTVLHFVGAYK